MTLNVKNYLRTLKGSFCEFCIAEGIDPPRKAKVLHHSGYEISFGEEGVHPNMLFYLCKEHHNEVHFDFR